MKKLFPLFCLLLTGSMEALSQQTTTVFYDQFHEKLPSHQNASYYAVYTQDPQDNQLEQVKETNMLNKAYHTGTVTKGSHLPQGLFKYYDGEGQLQKEITYAKGVREGVASIYEQGHKTMTYTFSDNFIQGPVTEYYASGKVRAQKNYLAHTDEIITVLKSKRDADTAALNYLLQQNRSDTLSLKEKTNRIEGLYDGISTYYYESGQVASEEEFEKGRLIKALFYNPEGKLVRTEKNPWNLDKEPVYKYGYDHMNSMVQYPNKAYENGIRGTVVIRCTIDKNGRMSNVKIIKAAHKFLNEEALRVVNSTKDDWSAARYHNMPISRSVTIPIYFRIEL